MLVFYAVLFAIEGIGLVLRKRWGEWFSAILTATGIPPEIYLLMHHATNPKLTPLTGGNGHSTSLIVDRIVWLKIVVLLFNVAIVWYLVAHLIRTNRAATAAPPPDAEA